jgi:hypothetical protein
MDMWVDPKMAEWAAGLPVHLAMDVNADGDGPLDKGDPTFDREACWCGDDGCRKYPAYVEEN